MKVYNPLTFIAFWWRVSTESESSIQFLSLICFGSCGLILNSPICPLNGHFKGIWHISFSWILWLKGSLTARKRRQSPPSVIIERESNRVKLDSGLDYITLNPFCWWYKKTLQAKPPTCFSTPKRTQNLAFVSKCTTLTCKITESVNPRHCYLNLLALAARDNSGLDQTPSLIVYWKLQFFKSLIDLS